MRFKVGEKVIVKSFSERPKHWDPDGKMDKWMGKVVTITQFSTVFSNRYLIKEDIREYNGGWFWKESDFLPIPKPGDKVKLRTWEDMEKQYGLDHVGDIKTPEFKIVSRMKEYCGAICTVKTNLAIGFDIEEASVWTWGFETIEEVYPKEEKMEFTKDMLKSGEHVVKLRDGYRLLYLNERLVGCESGTDIRFYSSDLRNTGCESDKLDIMAVYKATAGNTLDIILKHSNELIWKRDDEPIEIPATEAFAQLREIYGKEVKIVEDKDD